MLPIAHKKKIIKWPNSITRNIIINTDYVRARTHNISALDYFFVVFGVAHIK